jgi:hypothetical protein
MPNRRELLIGVPTVFASAVLWNNGSDAFNLGGVLKRVAVAAVQGLNFVTNPAQQVAAVTKVLTPIVQQISPDAGRAVTMINKIAEQSSTLEGRLKIISSVLLPQALPIFANTGFSNEQVPTFTEQAAQPLQLTSSTEDELRTDPNGYILRNADFLGDYVKTRSFGLVPRTFVVNAGDVVSDSVPAIGIPLGSGFYPSVMAVADLLRLVSIFRG